jgi:hypothetical protein
MFFFVVLILFGPFKDLWGFADCESITKLFRSNEFPVGLDERKILLAAQIGQGMLLWLLHTTPLSVVLQNAYINMPVFCGNT